MSNEIIYLTAEGMNKLKEELHHMVSVERPAAAAAIAAALDATLCAAWHPARYATVNAGACVVATAAVGAACVERRTDRQTRGESERGIQAR